MHFEIGVTAKSQLSMEQNVPLDLEWAVKKNVNLKGCIDAWRASQFSLLENGPKKDIGLESRLEAKRSCTSVSCSSHVYMHRLSLIIQAIQWPDTELVADVIEGFKPLGVQKSIGIYREKFTQAVMPIEALLVRMQPEIAKLRCR